MKNTTVLLKNGTKQLIAFEIQLKNATITIKNLVFSGRKIQGCELIGRPGKVSIGDQLETTFEVKRRPFGDCFEDN